MGLLSFALAAGCGAAAVVVAGRVKEKNPDRKPTVDDYVNETKAFASEAAEKVKDTAPVVTEKVKEAAPVVTEKVGEAVEKVKDFIESQK